ncbi:MAG: helicase loading protein [Bacilli bacterium]
MLIELILPPTPTMKVDGMSVYKLYLMCKGHFAGRYDCIKYNWTMRISPKAFEKRRDKYFFVRMSNKYTLGELYKIFVSNLLANADAWVGDISGADALQFYRQHMGKLDRASYIFKEDIENLVYFCKNKSIMFKDLFDCSKGQPIIFKMLQQEIISYETFLIIDAAGKFIDKMNESLRDDIVWCEYYKRIDGYRKILKINSGEAKSLFRKVYTDNVG